MILTVTPNAVVDKTYRVENFALDTVNRPQAAYTVAGGKGINVARVFQTLGGQAITTGFLGGVQGQIVARSLAEENIPNEFVPISGETRICIAVVDPVHGTQTEINERGPQTTPENADQLLKRVSTLLSQQAFEFVVLSGSLPPGTPDTLYAELIGRAQAYDVRVVLDTSGEPLRIALEALPWMVKPNRAELEAILERPLATADAVREAARNLHGRGIENVVVSLGAQGALLVCASGEWQSVPPKIEFASAVASGDSFVAAFLWSWLHGAKPADAESALRLATGAGAANAAVIGAGFCTRESIFDHAQRATVEWLTA